MASKKHVFEEWLSEKLKSLELDTDIYVDYFCSVLDETKTDIEVKELLQDILEGVLVRLFKLWAAPDSGHSRLT